MQSLSVALIACGMFSLHRFANLALLSVLSSLNLLVGLRASTISSHCQSVNTLLCGPLLFRCFKTKDVNTWIAPDIYPQPPWGCSQSARRGLWCGSLLRGPGTQVTLHFCQPDSLQQMILSHALLGHTWVLYVGNLVML